MIIVGRRTSVGAVAAMLGAALVTTGCGQRNAHVPPPPPDVRVATAVQRPMTVYAEFTGTTQASAMVAVRSRVQGYLASIHFVDGCDVKEGDVLFVIDPRPYQAKLDEADADLQSKEAAVARAEALYKRTLNLFHSGASNQEDVDKDRGDWAVAKAGVVQAKANVREAQLNLDWTIVKSPMTGRISRRLVDVGNLVTADNTILTTITRYDPLYAYFTVSENDRLAYSKRQHERAAGSSQAESAVHPQAMASLSVALSLAPPAGPLLAAFLIRAETPTYPIELGLANEEGYPHTGNLDFSDNTVDAGTGTLQLRGTFANPLPYQLAPGLFVRVRVPVGNLERALLVPERALGADQSGQYLLVVGGDDVVEHRPITVGARDGELRVVEQGLKPNDRFIIEGLQRAQPGTKVHAVDDDQPTAGK